jgi:uncharacterized membrane protein
VLAWVGALAVVVGLFLLLVIAISNGWIGETARTVMAGATSLALLAAGARLHARRGRTEASLAELDLPRRVVHRARAAAARRRVRMAADAPASGARSPGDAGRPALRPTL